MQIFKNKYIRTIKKGVKISLKLLIQNMNKELYIKILELKLPKWENIEMKIGSFSLKMFQTYFKNDFRIS